MLLAPDLVHGVAEGEVATMVQRRGRGGGSTRHRGS